MSIKTTLSQVGYKVINTAPGQLIFRKNPLGRAFVRWAGALSKMLPLQAPQTVMVDICNVCNFKCTFCPTSDIDLLKSVGRPNGLMGFDLFKKIIDDLKAFGGQISVLDFHKDGEPLLNKDVAKYVAYAKQAKVAATVEITTNASKLTPALADALIDAGLDSMRVSVEHVSAEGYRELTQTYGNYDQIVQNVAYIYAEKRRRKSKLKVLVKIIDTGLKPEEREKFYRDFRPISDVARIEGIMGWSFSEQKDFTLGLKPTVGMDGVTPLKPDRIVCPEPFKMMAINFNGNTSPCCDDWAHKLIVGNAQTQSVKDIWNGERLGDLRFKHLAGRRGELAACANCQYMLGVTDLFDLDKARGALIQRYGYDGEVVDVRPRRVIPIGKG